MQEIQETWIWSLGKEDPLEEEMATHSSFLAWEIPWTEEPGRLQSMGSQRVGHEWACLQDTGKQVRESAYLLCLKENLGPSCWSPSPAYKRNSGLSWHQLWHQPQWPQGAISLSKVTHRSLRWCSHILPGKSHEWRSLIGCGPLRVRHDWATSFSLFTFTHWRRKWQPTPVFLPGESQGRGKLGWTAIYGVTRSGTRLKWLSSSRIVVSFKWAAVHFANNLEKL